MGWLDRWDVILLLVAAYVASMTLVRMMTQRRDRLVADVEKQLKVQHELEEEAARQRKLRRDAAA